MHVANLNLALERPLWDRQQPEEVEVAEEGALRQEWRGRGQVQEVEVEGEVVEEVER